MVLDYDISLHDDVARMLGIAKRHLDYITRSKNKTIEVPGLKIDHAVVAIVFCASAVEAGLNIFISLPVLFIENKNIQSFMGTLVTKYQRLSIRQKINLAKETCKPLKNDNELIKTINELFDYRNAIVHSSQEYIAPMCILANAPEIPEEYINKDPSLVSSIASSEDVPNAYKFYDSAVKFLDKLTIIS